jgi:hypothetical protein
MIRSAFAACLVLLPIVPSARADDLEVLKKADVATGDAELVKFFREHTLDDAEFRQLEKAAARLGSNDAKEREDVRQSFRNLGRRGLGVLRAEQTRATQKETIRRLEEIRGDLEKKVDRKDTSDVVLAAARMLLQRHVKGAEATLLAYLPSSSDDVEEDLLALLMPRLKALGGVRELVNKETLPARQGLLLYAAGRYLGPDERDWILGHVKNASTGLRRQIVEGLIGKTAVRNIDDTRETDEQTLKTAKFAPDAASLLGFFKGRTKSSEELERIQGWLRDLGHADYRIREEATVNLTKQGPIVLPFLRGPETGNDPEMLRRAALVRQTIRNGPGPELPIAAVRELIRGDASPSEAVPVLLGYAPFTDNETVAEELHTGIAILTARAGGGQLLDDLRQAGRDSQPARRAAAAVVLGEIGTPEQLEIVRVARKDADPLVRLRGVQGMLSAADRDAVLDLIELLPAVPAAQLSGIEETLQTLAGDATPTLPMFEDTAAGRTKLRDTWKRWWADHKQAVDLAVLRRGDTYQGLITICEYDSGFPGRGNGKVWQRGRDGRTRWIQEGFLGAMYAQALPGNRVLVAENMGNRVVERDAQGNVVWEYRTNNNPIACQRLPNGNTFIATYNQVLEVTPEKKEVMTYSGGPAFYLFSAERTKDGRVVCMTAQGELIELDAADGKQLNKFRAIQGGGWCSAQALPNGRYLVASMSNNGGQIREIDAQGVTHWQANYQGVFRAVKLPTGNIVAVSMTTRKIAELDREGRVRWEVTCTGRPWSVQYR